MQKPKITVVLNVYKRSSNFQAQLEAIKNQSITPFEIMVWENGNETVPEHMRDGLVIARCNSNLGVWARFAYALNSGGDYVCLFDDDTVPGSRWFENCVAALGNVDGLLGTRGVIFDSGQSYTLNRDVGVHNPNEELTQVDIVGHSWFFRKKHLGAFWSLVEDRLQNSLAGEDIHFSYAIQKIHNLATYVPPHPQADRSLWGSQPEIAAELGTNAAAISKGAGAMKKFEDALRHYRKLGFAVIADSVPSEGKNVRKRALGVLISRFPDAAHRLAALPIFGSIWRRIK